MALVRWKPASELQREIDDMVNTFWGTSFTRGTRNTAWPVVDIYEKESGYRLEAELPGISRDDFSVTVHDNALTIEGEKKATSHETSGYARKERAFGEFSRTFSLGKDVKADSINASFANGILTLDVPKAEEAMPRQIEVKVN